MAHQKSSRVLLSSVYIFLLKTVFGREDVYSCMIAEWSRTGSKVKLSKIKHYIGPIARTLSYVIRGKTTRDSKKPCPHVSKRKSKYMRKRR